MRLLIPLVGFILTAAFSAAASLEQGTCIADAYRVLDAPDGKLALPGKGQFA